MNLPHSVMKVISGWNSLSEETEWYPLIASNTVFFCLGGICSINWNGNPQYNKLIETIRKEFPKTRTLTVPGVREYWEVRHCLSVDDGLVTLDQRNVIPTSQCAKVLHSLHFARQDEVGMKACANESVYWPKMKTPIRNIRANSILCSKTAPSQPKELINLTPSVIFWPSTRPKNTIPR